MALHLLVSHGEPVRRVVLRVSVTCTDESASTAPRSLDRKAARHRSGRAACVACEDPRHVASGLETMQDKLVCPGALYALDGDRAPVRT